jgi:membrane protein DedA with SNARE-associated domain
MDFHATVLEVILIAGVGAYIGFLVGLRSGAFLAMKNKSRRKTKSSSAQSSKFSTKKKTRPTLG